MSSARALQINSAFGKSLAEAVLLAQHPAERVDARGLPQANARTFVLRLQGSRAVLVEERPLPLVRSAYSASGVAYIGTNERNTVQKWQAGRWSEEVFSPKPVDFIRYVFAVPGATPEDDTVFLMGNKRIFIRSAGKWLNLRAPGEGLSFQADGFRADHVFIGGPTLSMWDGKKLVELESPERDTMGRMVLSADDRLVGGNSDVNISKPDGTWGLIDTPTKGFYAYARFRDEVYVISDDMGLLKVYPGDVRVLSPRIDPLGLVSVGDALIAYGTDGAFIWDGGKCTPIDMPVCEVGKQPV
ncbi:MAG TPA: hypothetical protein VK841_04870 [Polyangiaceae bacterium]|jgi:hypothetical protein|nr:hypothetical protein [Polyangiaceae bacterium]